MVARRSTKERSESPCLNVRMELDNRALKSKNSTLTQTVAKLQQEKAELVKQLSILQGDSFEINSKYNNLKNVISIIDSTTKTCLPKLNELAETFTGIIHLCSVAANISSFSVISPPNRDARTQAVKPQIVNGHILHNPTITLSRLSNDNSSNTPPRSNLTSNITVRPSTSRGSSGNIDERNRILSMMRSQEENSDSDTEDNRNDDDDGEQYPQYVCQANKPSHRQQSVDMDMNIFQGEDFENSDEENEEPLEEESQQDPRLTTIHEMDEEQLLSDSGSPRSRQRSFLNGRLQEVRIYLNQLPNTYIEQFLGTGNISISVSPPERRSSYKHRPSSLVGEASESIMDNGRSYLEEQFNRTRLSQGGECSFNETLRLDENQVKRKPLYKSPVRAQPSQSLEGSSNVSAQLSGNISSIRNLQTPSSSSINNSDPNSMYSESLQGLDLMHIQLQHKTSTPLPQRRSGEAMDCSDMYINLSRSINDTSMFNRNVTKRSTARDKRKVAKVLLDRLSGEKSPLKVIEDIVNMPPIRKSSELRIRLSNESKTDSSNKEKEKGPKLKDDDVGKNEKSKPNGRRRKKDSPNRKVGDNITKSKLKTIAATSPVKSPVGRPKRAARPMTLKEPSLTKKMRRSR